MGMELSIIGASRRWPTAQVLVEVKRDPKSLAATLREAAKDLAAMLSLFFDPKAQTRKVRCRDTCSYPVRGTKD